MNLQKHWKNVYLGVPVPPEEKENICQCGHDVKHHQVGDDLPKNRGCRLCKECTGYEEKR